MQRTRKCTPFFLMSGAMQPARQFHFADLWVWFLYSTTSLHLNPYPIYNSKISFVSSYVFFSLSTIPGNKISSVPFSTQDIFSRENSTNRHLFRVKCWWLSNRICAGETGVGGNDTRIESFLPLNNAREPGNRGGPQPYFCGAILQL